MWACIRRPHPIFGLLLKILQLEKNAIEIPNALLNKNDLLPERSDSEVEGLFLVDLRFDPPQANATALGLDFQDFHIEDIAHFQDSAKGDL